MKTFRASQTRCRQGKGCWQRHTLPCVSLAQLCTTFFLASLVAGCGGRTDEELKHEIEAALSAGNPAAALDATATLSSRYPSDFDTLGIRSGVLLLAGRGAEAKQGFEALAKLDLGKAAQLRDFLCDRAIWKARELSSLKPPIQALKLLDSVLTIFPDAPFALHDRGAIKLDLKDYKGAEEDFTRAIRNSRGNNMFGDSHLLRARAREGLGDAAGAVEDRAMADKRSGRNLEAEKEVDIELDRILSDQERSAVFDHLMSLTDGPGRSVSAIELSTHHLIMLKPVNDQTNLMSKIAFGRVQATSPRKLRVVVDPERLRQLVEQAKR